MKLLVTGSGGFVGPRLIRGLADSGHTGIAVSRRPLADMPSGWGFQDREAVLSTSHASPPDAIIHLEVKQHAQNPTPADIREFQSVNVEGTQRWLDWAGYNGVQRFIFFSSIKAAGDSPHCQDESSHSLPNTPYGQSKLAAEKRVREWALGDAKRSALLLRPAVIYGPGNQANILSLIQAIDRRRFFLVGRNQNVKSLSSIVNLVAAVNHLLTLPARGVELYYLTDHENFSVARIATMILQIMHRPPSPRALPLPLARTLASFGDIIVKLTGRGFPLTRSRLAALLESTHFSSAKLSNTGFHHPQTTEEGLAEMIEWYKSSSPGRK